MSETAYFKYKQVWISEAAFDEEARVYGEGGWELMHILPREKKLPSITILDPAKPYTGEYIEVVALPIPGYQCVFKKRGA